MSTQNGAMQRRAMWTEMHVAPATFVVFRRGWGCFDRYRAAFGQIQVVFGHGVALIHFDQELGGRPELLLFDQIWGGSGQSCAGTTQAPMNRFNCEAVQSKRQWGGSTACVPERSTRYASYAHPKLNCRTPPRAVWKGC